MFDALAAEHLTRPSVDMGRMLSAPGLRIRTKAYAFVTHDGTLIAKVPRERAEELVAEGVAEHMLMRQRRMKEWISVAPGKGLTVWSGVLEEAHDFVDSITPH